LTGLFFRLLTAVAMGLALPDVSEALLLLDSVTHARTPLMVCLSGLACKQLKNPIHTG
jgi:hypothetical protein